MGGRREEPCAEPCEERTEDASSAMLCRGPGAMAGVVCGCGGGAGGAVWLWLTKRLTLNSPPRRHRTQPLDDAE